MRAYRAVPALADNAPFTHHNSPDRHLPLCHGAMRQHQGMFHENPVILLLNGFGHQSHRYLGVYNTTLTRLSIRHKKQL
jgi:hypothetical protein